MNRTVIRVLACAVLLMASDRKASADETPYRLGAQDRVRLRVTEWRAARGETYVWEAMTGEYSVDAAGRLTLPLLGAIHVGGRTTDEIGATIGEQLQRKVGLVQRPDAAVEVAEFRPVYIVGVVDKPGAYPFRPRLTVLQAVSLAGGLYRPPGLAELRFARESIGVEGDLREASVERNAVLAKRARLEAESREQTTITYPTELTGPGADPAAANAMREEQALFDSRREALRSQIVAITQAKEILDTEIQALQAKIVSQDRQIGLARKELTNINSLIERGLAVNPRQLALEQSVAQLESLRLDTQVAISRARQDLSRNDRTILDLSNQRKTLVLSELRETQIRLTKLEEKTQTARGLLAETALTAPQVARQRRDTERSTPIYALVRVEDGESRELVVGENEAVLPGDVLKVSTKRSDEGSVTGLTQVVPSDGRPVAVR